MAAIFFRFTGYRMKLKFAFSTNRYNISLFQYITVRDNAFPVYEYFSAFNIRNHTASGCAKCQTDDTVQTRGSNRTGNFFSFGSWKLIFFCNSLCFYRSMFDTSSTNMSPILHRSIPRFKIEPR